MQCSATQHCGSTSSKRQQLSLNLCRSLCCRYVVLCSDFDSCNLAMFSIAAYSHESPHSEHTLGHSPPSGPSGAQQGQSRSPQGRTQTLVLGAGQALAGQVLPAQQGVTLLTTCRRRRRLRRRRLRAWLGTKAQGWAQVKAQGTIALRTWGKAQGWLRRRLRAWLRRRRSALGSGEGSGLGLRAGLGAGLRAGRRAALRAGLRARLRAGLGRRLG